MGHRQPATPVHCDNATAVGIANSTVKRQRSRLMEMRYFWVVDQCNKKHFIVVWCPGQEILADYQSKHHMGSHHLNVRPWYLHSRLSPRVLPRALAPRSMRRCVGSAPGGYTGKAPLPAIRTRTGSGSKRDKAGAQACAMRAGTRIIPNAWDRGNTN